jgi:phosphoglycolate phosphatase-like HAD superfamily hydrolase
MAWRLVVFDMDHTVTASPHLPGAWVDALVEHGATQEQALAACRDGGGRPSVATAQACFPAMPELWPPVLERFSRLCRERESYRALPGADWLLRTLRAHGVTLVLSTGATQEHAERVMREAGWHELFTHIHGSAEAFTKTEHLAALATSFDPQTAASVGDGPTELRAARDAGLRIRIGVLAHNGIPPADQRRVLRAAGATHFVDDLFQVAPLLLAAK